MAIRTPKLSFERYGEGRTLPLWWVSAAGMQCSAHGGIRHSKPYTEYIRSSDDLCFMW